MTRRRSLFPLPEFAHIPGLNARHEEEFLAHVINCVPKETLDRTAGSNTAWLYGLQLIEAGFYWEAHEVLETVWLNASPNGRERQLVRCMIHIANAALKVRMGRSNAALKLSKLAESCLELAWRGHRTSTLMGLKKGILVTAIELSNNPDAHMDFGTNMQDNA